MPAKTNVTELRSLPQLCKTICLPGDYSPVRLPTYPAVERTSVLALNATDTYPVGPPDAKSAPTRGLLFKHSVFPLWLDQNSTATSLGDSRPLGWWMEWAVKAQAASGDVLVLPNAYAWGSGSGNTTNGVLINDMTALRSYVPVGELESEPYLYTGKGSYGIYVKVPTGSPTGTIDIVIDCATPGGEKRQQIYTLNAVAGGWFASILSDGYFVRPSGITQTSSSFAANSVTIVACSAVATTSDPRVLTVTSNGIVPFTTQSGVTPATLAVPSMLPFFNAPGLDVSRIPFSNTRCTAVSALFTNVTKALNKEGTVLAGRLNPTSMNVMNFSASSFATVLPCEKYYYGLETGFYTFAPLVSNSEEFSDDVYSRAGESSFTPWMHLGNKGLINSFIFSDPDGDTILAINLDWHIEFRNSSVLWPVAISGVSLETAHQVQLALLEAGFFYDNTIHTAILNGLMNAVNRIMPAMKAAGRLALRNVPGVSTTMRAVTREMNRMSVSKRTPPRRRRERKPPRSRKPQEPRVRPKPSALNVDVRPGRKMRSGLDLYLQSKR